MPRPSSKLRYRKLRFEGHCWADTTSFGPNFSSGILFKAREDEEPHPRSTHICTDGRHRGVQSRPSDPNGRPPTEEMNRLRSPRKESATKVK